MNALQKVFNYQGSQVRTIIRDGEPWFVAADVCNVLGLNTSEAVNGRGRSDNEGLDDDEKGIDIVDTPGGKQQAIVVSEAGLYSLVLKSRKPEAKQFKRWITHEVIPSIRKTGTYQLQPKTQLEILQGAINALVEQESRIKALEDTAQHIKDTIIIQPDNWREDINRMFNKIVDKVGGKKFQELRSESYKLLEDRARVNLSRRLDNLKFRLLKDGATKTAIDRACKLDVIEADPKLQEIYSQIIKEYTIKYVS